MKTPLYDEHLSLNAKMTDFAGWDMPLQYAGIAPEVEAVRNNAGLFDICHMGELIISGEESLTLLQNITTNDVSKIAIGKAQYNLICNDSGGVIDDIIVYRLQENEYLVIVNASNLETDYKWICSKNTYKTDVKNISASTALIALQGPKAQEILQQLTGFDLSSLKRFSIAEFNIGGIECKVCRTGYTGEDGFELICEAINSVKLWKLLLETGKDFGIQPIGLGARDVLRLEAAYSLHGHEISPEINPVSAKLMWAVKPEKGDFIGKESILKVKEQGAKQILIGLEAVDRSIPRHGSAVLADGNIVGKITSGTFSPTLGKPIALAFVDVKYSEVGSMVDVVITPSRNCACRVVKTPFYSKKI